MSTIHGKWSVDDIRNVIRRLDEKTGMNGAALSIDLYKSLRSGKTLGLYRPSCGVHTRAGGFRFAREYLDDADFKDLAVIDVIRHEYAHYLVDALNLNELFEDQDAHGIAWKTVCGLLNTDQEGVYCWWHFHAATEKGLRRALEAEDIPHVDILKQIERWGRNLPSLAERKCLEGKLIKKYTRNRIFSVNDRVIHQKYGQGTVVDTMPSMNKQMLYVRFENGEYRMVQNRQVYKIINEQVRKPVSKAG